MTNGRKSVGSYIFEMSDDNLARMAKGKAPIGFDGKPVELHHVKGIKNSIEVVEITRTNHTILHKFIGYKDFADYILKTGR